jgi:hypothetical protein
MFTRGLRFHSLANYHSHASAIKPPPTSILDSCEFLEAGAALHRMAH